MATPPDGHHPVMQMYLQHEPHAAYRSFQNGGDPFSPTNVGDEADTVYHEYTHGLSNRLVVDVQDRSTLGFVQAGAMGEGWSDWYAMDYLVRKGLAPDRPHRTDVVIFPYDGKGVKVDRTEPMDCKVGRPSTLCTGGATNHGGGYTYRDYGKVVGSPEVHGDSEIWSQTLWSMRHSLGLHEVRGTGHPGHGARAVQPVVPRHAQRDPARRHVGLPGRGPRGDLEGVRVPRDGLLRRQHRRRRQARRARTSTRLPRIRQRR